MLTRHFGALLRRFRLFHSACFFCAVSGLSQGFNCSCFAYGHTGSGKTYSMFGCSDDTSLPDDEEALAAPPQGEGFGLVPRICYSLLHRLQEANEGKHGLPEPANHGRLDKAVGCCCLQVFCPYIVLSWSGDDRSPFQRFLLPCLRGSALHRRFETSRRIYASTSYRMTRRVLRATLASVQCLTPPCPMPMSKAYLVLEYTKYHVGIA